MEAKTFTSALTPAAANKLRMKTPLILLGAIALAPVAFAVEYTVFHVVDDTHIIRTSDGKEAGHVEYLIVDPETQRIVSTIVSGGAVGEKFVAVPYQSMHFGTGREVTLTEITRERLISAPVIERRTLTTNVIEPAVFQRASQHFGVRFETTVGGAPDRPGAPIGNRHPRPGEPNSPAAPGNTTETRIVMPGGAPGNPPASDPARPGLPGQNPTTSGQTVPNPARPGQPAAPNNLPSTSANAPAQPGQNARPSGTPAPLANPAAPASPNNTPNRPGNKARPGTGNPDRPTSAERPPTDDQPAKPNHPGAKADTEKSGRPAKDDQPVRNRKSPEADRPAGEKPEAGAEKRMRDRPNADKPHDGDKPKAGEADDRPAPGKGARKTEHSLEKAGEKAEHLGGKMKDKTEGEAGKAAKGQEKPSHLPDAEKRSSPEKKDRQ